MIHCISINELVIVDGLLGSESWLEDKTAIVMMIVECFLISFSCFCEVCLLETSTVLEVDSIDEILNCIQRMVLDSNVSI